MDLAPFRHPQYLFSTSLFFLSVCHSLSAIPSFLLPSEASTLQLKLCTYLIYSATSMKLFLKLLMLLCCNNVVDAWGGGIPGVTGLTKFMTMHGVGVASSLFLLANDPSPELSMKEKILTTITPPTEDRPQIVFPGTDAVYTTPKTIVQGELI